MTEDLFEKYCLGALSPDEARELRRGLASSAGIRRALALHLQERSILVQAAGRRAASRRRTRVGRKPRGGALWIAAAAAAVAFCFSLPASPPPPRPAKEQRAAVPPEPPRPSAKAVPVVEAPRREEPPAPWIVPKREWAAPPAELPPPPPVEPRPTPRATVAQVWAFLPGGAVSTGPKGSEVFQGPDGTRLELGPATVLRELDSSRLQLIQGTLLAEVAQRPPGRPLVVATPQGEATVLGTVLRLIVGPSTRLDVSEGLVRLTRAGDGRSLDVGAGEFAVISSGEDFSVRKRELQAEEFDRMPAWSSVDHAVWGGAASWTLGSGRKGSGLTASRAGRGSSVVALVCRIPAGETLELSVFMKCPKLQGRTWAEFGYRLGEHHASDFDSTADKWTVVRKFDGYGGQNGNGGAWTRYSATVETGKSTKLTVAFKIGSHDGGAPAVGWDSLQIRRP